ncbi:MAG: hypothetical protein P1V36_17980 [Planctomycetota bacterium]|nr:hypothetical protein [Planctomycetota bacterium]
MKQRAILNGKLLNPNDYLAAVELQQDVTLTIKSVQHEKLMRQDLRDPEIKPTLSFKETDKRLVLGNRTNEDTVCKLHGTDAAKWVGKQITVYATTTKMGRDTVPCIRIRPNDPGKGPEPVGAATAKKVAARLEKAGLGFAAMRIHFEQEGDIKDWPKSLLPKMAAWIDEQEKGE